LVGKLGDWPSRCALVLSTLLGIGLQLCCTPKPIPPALLLEASQALYASGSLPIFTLNLVLDSSAPSAWTVCSMAAGSISVARLTKDGKPVRPTREMLDLLNRPERQQAASLVLLSPGKRVSIPFELAQSPVSPTLILSVQDLTKFRTIEPCPSTATRAAELLVTPPDRRAVVHRTPAVRGIELVHPDPPIACDYAMPRPGLYTLKLRYEYVGPDGSNTNVFHDSIESNEISFELD
jgi:hypothetical protein